MPGAGLQLCSSWSGTLSSSLPAPRSEGQPYWGHQEPHTSKSKVLRVFLAWGGSVSPHPQLATGPQIFNLGWGPCHSWCNSCPICLTGTAAAVGEEPLSWPACPAPGVRLPWAVCACGGHLGGDGKRSLHILSLRPLSWASLLGFVTFCRPFTPFCGSTY